MKKGNRKIIFFIDSPGYGGSEINALKLIDFLTEYFLIELVLNYTHCEEIDRYAANNNIKTHFFYVQSGQVNIFKGLFKANKILNSFKNDTIIIWSHHLDSNRWIQLCAALKKIKFIIVEQLIPTNFSELSKSRLTIPIKKFVLSKSFCNIICGYSQEENYRNFFSVKNVTVIPNSRNIQQIKDAVLQYSQTFVPAIPLKGIRICSIGRLTEQKDPLTIVKAVHALKEQYQLSLVLVGDGELMPDLRHIVETEEMDNVFLIGHDPAPLKWLAYTDIFILNSVSEGLPGALIEAMAAGVPCIATDIPGNRDLIINGETGLTIPIKDVDALIKAIEKMICDPDKRKKISLCAYTHVLNSYDVVIERCKWLKILQNVDECYS